MIVERRKGNRYRLGIPVVFSWGDAGQRQHDGFGLTRDVSIRGAFVLTTSPPPLGAHIKLKAFLPPVVGVPTSTRIQAEGKVVRVEANSHDKGLRGFATEGKRFVLRRDE